MHSVSASKFIPRLVHMFKPHCYRPSRNCNGAVSEKTIYPLGLINNKLPDAFFKKLTPQEKATFRRDEYNKVLTSIGRCEHIDLMRLVDVLCNIDEATRVFKSIDTKLAAVMTEKQKDALDVFAKDAFQKAPYTEHLNLLFAMREVFISLAKVYNFEPNIIESSTGVIDNNLFIEKIVKSYRLFLDLSNTGHGPLPHALAQCVLEEMQIHGKVYNAKETYCRLGEKLNFGRIPYFLYVLDNEDSQSFCNPAVISNYLIGSPELFPYLSKVALVCRKQEELLLKTAELWAHSNESVPDVGRISGSLVAATDFQATKLTGILVWNINSESILNSSLAKKNYEKLADVYRPLRFIDSL